MGPLRGGLDRVEPGLAMRSHQCFGARVIRFEFGIGNRPGRGDAGLVLQFLEVLLAEANCGGAEKLGVAADIIVGAGTEQRAVLVAPLFLGGIFALVEDRVDAPIVGFTRQPGATLDHQYVAARCGQAVGQRSAPDTGTDDDDVVALFQGSHERFPSPSCGVCSQVFQVLRIVTSVRSTPRNNDLREGRGRRAVLRGVVAACRSR
jgi:hypothetical protein